MEKYQFPSERLSEEALPSPLDAGQPSLARRSSRTSGHRLAPFRASAPFPSMSSSSRQRAPVTNAANALQSFNRPKKQAYRMVSSSSLTSGMSMARSYPSASAVVKSPTRGTPNGPRSTSSTTLGHSSNRAFASGHVNIGPVSHARMTSPPSSLHQPSYAVPSQQIRSQYRENAAPAKRRAGDVDTVGKDNPPKTMTTAESQGAYLACETHALVPSVKYVKSLTSRRGSRSRT